MTGNSAFSAVGCAIRLPGGTLVLAAPRWFGGAAAGLRAHAGERLRRLLGVPHAMATLRAAWHRLGLPGIPERLGERQTIDLLAAAVAANRLSVAFFPHLTDPEDRLASGAASAPALPAPAPTAKAAAVRDMSRAQRIEAALKLVPKHLSGPLKDAFLSLISPTSIAITVGAFVALAVGQFFGYGEVADAALAVIAYSIAGLAGVRALYEMVAATVNAAGATSDAEIEAAAARLAAAIVVLGMAFLTVFITRAARKAARSRASSERTGAPPERESGSGGRQSSSRPPPPSGTVENLDPKDVRFSQNSAGGGGRADQLRRSMAEKGWDGPPVDAVRTPDGVVAVDNTRVAVAREQGMSSIPVRVWNQGDRLPQAMIDNNRFGPSETWGEALAYRTGRQIPPLGPTGTGTPPFMSGSK